MQFYTLDRKQQTGGELKTVQDFIGAGSNHNAMQNGTITIKPAKAHGHPVTVHIRNIVKFNGQKVFW